MIIRILVSLMLLVLGAGFIFFVGNVIWLGTKEFFKIYGPKSKNLMIKDINTETKKTTKRK